MAVAVGTGTIQGYFTAQVQDGLGTKASAQVYLGVPDTATVAEALIMFGEWIAALDGTTDGAIVASSVVFSPLVTGLKSAADGFYASSDFLESRVEQTAVLNMRSAASSRRFGVAIPAVIDAGVVGGRVDLANGAIAAMVTLLHDGTYTNLYGQALTALVDCILAFRKRRKELGRSSFEVPTT